MLNDNQEFRDVRLFYSKTGRAKYISHLDVMRAFQRAFKRSKIDFWFTEGFHPHLYLTFALPLSLGYESLAESVDFRVLSKDITYQEICEKINAQLPEGFEAYKASKPQMQPKDIKYAEYQVIFKCEETGVIEKWNDCFSRDEVIVSKKTKSGVKEFNIKEGMILSGLLNNGFFYSFTAKLPSGSETNINPDLLFAAFEEYSNFELSYKCVLRTAVYNGKMQNFM